MGITWYSRDGRTLHPLLRLSDRRAILNHGKYRAQDYPEDPLRRPGLTDYVGLDRRSVLFNQDSREWSRGMMYQGQYMNGYTSTSALILICKYEQVKTGSVQSTPPFDLVDRFAASQILYPSQSTPVSPPAKHRIG